MKTRREEKRFIAEDERQTKYEIMVYGTYRKKQGRWVRDELAELETSGGRHVNRVEQGVYDIVDGTSYIRITSDNPDAP